MGKLYAYCSNNQAYHALINNSIVAKALMKADLKSDTASQMSECFIFLSKDRLTEAVEIYGVPAAYYPVVLEVAFDKEANEIPAVLAMVDSNGDVSLSERDTLEKAFSDEKCVGAFICGELPITYLSRIIFDSDDKKVSFKKSSLDLWFPEDLYSVWHDEPISEKLTVDKVRTLSEAVDAKLDDEKKKTVINVVNKRLRQKAASYYAVEATSDWSVNSLKTNIDSALIGILDDDNKLQNCVKAALGDMADSFDEQPDVVLGLSADGIEKRLFSVITDTILTCTDVRGRVSGEQFNEIGRKCLDVAGESEPTVATALQTIKTFLGSTMDPDEALKAIGPHDVLRAFMIFLDQQENSDFLKRAASKLSQTERRYAYIMYGLLNGMYEVDRNYKSNRALEHQIEKKIMKMYSDEWLISCSSSEETSAFMLGEKAQDGAVFGIKPVISKWYDVETSHKLLMGLTDEKALESIYMAMSKSMRDNPILEQDVYSLKSPIIITVQIGDSTVEKYEISHKAEAKDFGKKIEKLVKKEKEDFNAEGFKKYLADIDAYKKFFKKNTDLVQELCRKNNR